MICCCLICVCGPFSHSHFSLAEKCVKALHRNNTPWKWAFCWSASCAPHDANEENHTLSIFFCSLSWHLRRCAAQPCRMCSFNEIVVKARTLSDSCSARLMQRVFILTWSWINVWESSREKVWILKKSLSAECDLMLCISSVGRACLISLSASQSHLKRLNSTRGD